MYRKFLSGLFAALAFLGLSFPALAASVLDTTLTTAMTAGFTDMKDTVSAVVAVAFPITVAIAALLAGVRLVIRMLKGAPK